MRGRIIGRFAQLVDHMLRRHAVRIAHPEIDNILTAGPRFRLHRVHFCEDIGRQALDAVKFFRHYRSSLTLSYQERVLCVLLMRMSRPCVRC